MQKYIFTFGFAITLLILCYATGQAQTGDQFPAIKGITLEDKTVTLPDDTKGKFTLIGMAFSKKSEDELNGWFGPVYNTFINKPKKPGLFDSFMYDVNVYFIPMFTGVNTAAMGTAKKKAMKGTDPRLMPYILFYKGDLKTYKEKLNFEKRDIPYFFVLDEKGKIIYTTSGEFTQEKLDEIEELLE